MRLQFNLSAKWDIFEGTPHTQFSTDIIVYILLLVLRYEGMEKNGSEHLLASEKINESDWNKH